METCSLREFLLGPTRLCPLGSYGCGKPQSGVFHP